MARMKVSVRSLQLVVGFALVTLGSWSALARGATIEAVGRSGAAGQALCLDVAGAHAANGTELIPWTCHGGRNQDFTFNRGTGELRSSLGNYCVDVAGGGAYAGNRVQLWTCHGGDPQRFRHDPARSALVYAPAPWLCLDVASGGARLADCNGSSGQRFEVSTRYGNRRFDELTWLTTHNAFNNYEDARWSVPNQSRGIARQLSDGVRGIMLDVYAFESGRTRCILSMGSDCYPRDLYLCHGNCGGVPGVQYALPRQRLSDALATVTEFLSTHPEEIVTVFLEDYSSHDELRASLDRVPHLRELLFDPVAADVVHHGWPRAADMVAANHRLLIISDNGSKEDLGVAYGPHFDVENHWSIGMWGDQYECKARWDSQPLDIQDPSFNRLFVMNQFRDAPTAIGAMVDNSASNLTRRMNQFCLPAAKRKPNYVAVDFYEIGDGGGIVGTVDESSVLLFSDGNFGGVAQVMTAGWHWITDVVIGNDAVSSLKVGPGAAVTLYDHDGFQGASRTFTGSVPWVGNDFNDRASSAAVSVSE